MPEKGRKEVKNMYCSPYKLRLFVNGILEEISKENPDLDYLHDYCIAFTLAVSAEAEQARVGAVSTAWTPSRR